MAVYKEVWARAIVQALFASNQFLSMAQSYDELVNETNLIHVPQAGGADTILVNNTTWPLTATQRTDTDLVIPIDNFHIPAKFVLASEMGTLSYNKIQSILGQNLAQLNDVTALQLLYRWANNFTSSGQSSVAAAGKVLTTGAANANALGGTVTGNRKALTKEDIRKLAEVMDAENVPQNGRVLLLPSSMYYQLFSDAELLRRDNTNEANLAKGIVNELFGFSIMKRSRVLIYAGGAAVKAPGQAAAAADQEAGLAWHPTLVARAMGATKVFDSKDDVLYQGDVVSGLVRLGGQKVRVDGIGVKAIVQDAAA